MSDQKKRTAVVNYAKGGWYPNAVERLKKSFDDNGFDGDYHLYTDESQLGCPSHQEMPYAFKAYALNKARDYDYVIWADAGIQLVKPFSKFTDHLEEHGYFFPLNGWDTGTWCSDAALPLLGITREESFNYPHMMACVMGFNMHDERCRKFLDKYLEHSKDGSFKGAWINTNNEVSFDRRVLGHRHDQTAASVIATDLGMEFSPHSVRYVEYKEGDPESIFFWNKGG